MKIKSEQEMLNFGREFANLITGRVTTLEGVPQDILHKQKLGERKSWQNPSGALVIELIGDVGTGKTTFTRGLAAGLGVKEQITSPSFTISKTYSLPNSKKLIHYDFYRLPDPGLMLNDLNESINDKNAITVIEWGESVSDILPDNRFIININYDDTNSREINFS